MLVANYLNVIFCRHTHTQEHTPFRTNNCAFPCWYYEIYDERYESMITKQEYEKIKTLFPEAEIYFDGWSKKYHK